MPWQDMAGQAIRYPKLEVLGESRIMQQIFLSTFGVVFTGFIFLYICF